MQSVPSLPLVVDLDGTLLRSDMLLETGLAFLRQQPLKTYKAFAWLKDGKVSLKQHLAMQAEIDVGVLPYEPKILDFINAEKAKGRTIVLATATHRLLADKIAAHLQVFDEVLATENGYNLSAANKASCLVARYGPKGFDYIGNSTDDLPVWAQARRAYLVNPDSSLLQRADQQNNVADIFYCHKTGIKDWLKALRLHQWLKNLLVFVPLLVAHLAFDPSAIGLALLAFLAFGLTASSVYLLNDMLDLADDRHHASKCKRPFAAGTLSLASGAVAFQLLVACAGIVSMLFLPWKFLLVLLCYYLLTLAYSFKLKRHASIDVISLAALYTVRIIAGAAALGLPLTFWILAFSMFIFLSLALVKRYAELADLHESGENQTRGRGYYSTDMPIIASLGTASGYLAVLVLALYVHEQSTLALYQQPKFMWLTCPLLLLWITRIWLVTHRNDMHEDPVVFAAKDPYSWMTIGLMLLSFWAAV